MFESSNRVRILSESDYAVFNASTGKELQPQGALGSALAKLSVSQVIEDHLFPADIVRSGSIIRLKDLGTGTTVQLYLARNSESANRFENDCEVFSVASPLGITLLGMGLNELVKWTLPNGHVRYLRIAEVSPESENA